MIIDVHTHLWFNLDQLGPHVCEQLRQRLGDQWNALDAGPEAHALAVEPVDVAIVLGFVSHYLQANVPNDTIAEYVKQYPDKLIGFAGIDPTQRGHLKELDQLVDQGFAGVTISPSAQDFHPSNTRAMQLYEKCEALGLPILVHQGTHFTAMSKMDYGQPFLFDEVARSYPKLKLILAHVGHPWISQTLALIGKHRNVFAELGNLTTRPWHLYNVLLEAHQLEVTDRLLFGSDFPYSTPQQAIETIYSLNSLTHGTGLPSIPREKLRAIVERDTLKLLGLPEMKQPERKKNKPKEEESTPVPKKDEAASVIAQALTTKIETALADGSIYSNHSEQSETPEQPEQPEPAESPDEVINQTIALIDENLEQSQSDETEQPKSQSQDETEPPKV